MTAMTVKAFSDYSSTVSEEAGKGKSILSIVVIKAD